MTTNIRSSALLVLLAGAAASAAPLAAQENYEIQVYPSQTATPRTTLFELHSNYTSKGSPNGVQFGTRHALHETVEITHGFTDIFEVGFYIFTARPDGEGLKFVATHIRPRVRAPESWHLPVGLSLSTEFGPTSEDFDANTFGIELRPIVDQQLGRLYWAFNPNIEWAMKGPGAGQGLDGMNFAPSLKLAWRAHEKFSIGTEYYGSTGTLTRMAPSGAQSHVLYPTVDFFFGPEWELNVGYGVLMSGSGDEGILKIIFGRRFDF